MNEKSFKVMLSILTIATVIVSVVGISFAYYVTTGSVLGSGGNLVTSTAKIGKIDFGEGGDSFNVDNIAPGWKEEKDITISSTPSDIGQSVKVMLRYTNGMPDLTLKVDKTDSIDGASVSSFTFGVSEEETEIELISVTFPKSSESITHTFKLTLELPEKDENQNANQGKVFDGTLYAKYDSVIIE